jgi:hypothetical protein
MSSTGKGALAPTWGRVSYWVELGHDFTPGKIDVYVEVFTHWRGQLVRAEFKFNRYTVSRWNDDGSRAGHELSEWRGYVHTAGEVESIEQHYGANTLTDTARRRIGEAFSEDALEIVKGANGAFEGAIVRAMRDLLAKSYDPLTDYNRFSRAYDDSAALGGDAFDVLRSYAVALESAKAAAVAVTEYCDLVKAGA